MAIPRNKDELIIAISTNYSKLRLELESIDIELTDLKELEAHRKNRLMSIHNLISYLIGWGELLIKWNEKKENKEEIYFPEKGFKWNQLGLLAEKFYEDYKDIDFPNLLIKFDKTIENILTLVNSKSNKELYEDNWYEKWSLGRMIQFNTSSPYLNAYKRVRKWKKSRL